MRISLTTTGIVLAVVLAGCGGSPQTRRDKFLLRGQERLDKKDYAHALLEFRNAAKAMPNDAECYFQIGNALMGERDYLGAYASYRKAQLLNPKHTGVQLKIAQLQAATNDPDMIKEAEGKL